MQEVTLIQTPDYEKDVGHDMTTGSAPGRESLDTLELCQTDTTYDRHTSLATLNTGIATFTGYASGVITWLPPSVDAAGEVEMIGTVPPFRPTDGVTPNQIYGAYIRNSANSKVHAVARLANPDAVPMAGPDNVLQITIRLRLGKTANVLELVY